LSLISLQMILVFLYLKFLKVCMIQLPANTDMTVVGIDDQFPLLILRTTVIGLSILTVDTMASIICVALVIVITIERCITLGFMIGALEINTICALVGPTGKKAVIVCLTRISACPILILGAFSFVAIITGVWSSHKVFALRVVLTLHAASAFVFA
jgi:hypothetical protein